VGGNTIHTFTTSGTLSPITSLSASYLVVAGGGSGGHRGNRSGGGGAGGGLLTGSSIIDTNSIYTVTVGAGGAGISASGAGSLDGNSGSNSVALGLTALGGGFGGAFAGGNGGSGGGGSGDGDAGGSGTSGQGNAGGAGFNTGGTSGRSGGGGGAGAVGGSATSSNGGTGAAGLASSISGSSVTYAGGGGGAVYNGGTPGAGGAGGGTAGASNSTFSSAATANTGGGSGGASHSSVNVFNGGSGNGGSGVVIISYAGTPQFGGGTVTSVGGNTIHTFTSSGYLSPIVLLNRSLRFRSSASAYLSRTPATNGNRQKFTFSYWVKRGTLSAAQEMYFTNAGGGTFSQFSFTSVNAITFASVTSSVADIDLTTSAVYRDPAAWYHIVLSVDTTQATNTNRVLIYVNGVVQAISGTYPAQNYNCQLNTTTSQNIGRPSTGTFDGYMAEYNFIDGQALTPSSFGSFNAYGSWSPVRYGGSYGTNGFYLPFTNNASTTTLGYDFSPNGNNWTTNNISLTAGSTYDSMTDVPTLTSTTAANYCVLNPLVPSNGGALTNGNLTWTLTGNFGTKEATIASPTLLQYAEFTIVSGVPGIGLKIPGSNPTVNPGTPPSGLWGYYDNTASWNIISNGSGLYSTGSIVSAGQIWQIAYNPISGNAWIGKDNVWYNSTGGTNGNPSAATNPTFSGLANNLVMCVNGGNVNGVLSANFGQQPFVYTPPSGFVALNTYNL
jgi:hypothetical protein